MQCYVFTRRWVHVVCRYHEMLDNEVEVEDPFELVWYENKRQENDAQALHTAAKNNMLDDVKTRVTMEGADVNRRTVDVRHFRTIVSIAATVSVLYSHVVDMYIFGGWLNCDRGKRRCMRRQRADTWR